MRIGKFTALWTVQIRNITALYFTLRHSLALPTHPPSLNTHTVDWGTVVGPETPPPLMYIISHLHKIINGSVIYTAPYVMYLRREYIPWASGRGLGPENLDFFGPQMALA